MNNNQRSSEGTFLCRSMTMPFKLRAIINEGLFEEILTPRLEGLDKLIEATASVIENRAQKGRDSFVNSQLFEEYVLLRETFDENMAPLEKRLLVSAKNKIQFDKSSEFISHIIEAAYTPTLSNIKKVVKSTANVMLEEMNEELSLIENSTQFKETVDKFKKILENNNDSETVVDEELVKKTLKTLINTTEEAKQNIYYDQEISKKISELASHTKYFQSSTAYLEEKPFSEKFANSPLVSKLKEYSPFEKERPKKAISSQYVYEVINELNKQIDRIAEKIEFQIRSSIATVYQEPNIVVHVTFKKGSIELLGTAIIGWAGGIIVNSSKEFFATQIKDLTKFALERAMSAVLMDFGISNYLGPMETETLELKIDGIDTVQQINGQNTETNEPEREKRTRQNPLSAFPSQFPTNLILFLILLGVLTLVLNQFFTITLK